MKVATVQSLIDLSLEYTHLVSVLSVNVPLAEASQPANDDANAHVKCSRVSHDYPATGVLRFFHTEVGSVSGLLRSKTSIHCHDASLVAI